MYAVTVLLLMAVLPIGSIVTDHFFLHTLTPTMSLVGKWFVFWGAGIRLFLAGLRQLFQPRYTAQKIFGMRGNDALPIIRELGVANLATGTVGILSSAMSGFILPLAIIASLFYGIAGIRHALGGGRARNQTIAMVSDLLAAVVFAVYAGFSIFTGNGA